MRSSRSLLGWSLLLGLLALPAHAAAEARPLSQAAREHWTYRDGLPHNVAHRLLASRDGYLWIGTQEGLVRFDGIRFKLYDVSSSPGLSSDEITALLEDDRGGLWIGTTRGLSRFERERFEPVDLGGDVSVAGLAADGEGGVWVATERSGVRHALRGRPAALEQIGGLADPRTYALAWVGKELWIGGHGGLSRLEAGRAKPFQAPGLPAAWVKRILAGRDGSVWVGAGPGLFRRRPGAAAFEPVALGLPGEIGELLEDGDGSVWVAQEGQVLARVRDGRVERVPGPAAPAAVHALAEDARGDLWIGSDLTGLHRLRWGAVTTVASEEGLRDDVVWTVREGRPGEMWVATDSGLDRVYGQSVEHVDAPGLTTGLAALLVDRAGALWVGTRDGLVRLHAGAQQAFGKADGLGGTLTRALCEDRGGTLWVGTAHGLFRREGARFAAVPSDAALPGDMVNVILERADGRVWVGTTCGLARVEEGRLVPVTAGGGALRGDVTALHDDAPGGALWVGTVGEGLVRLSGGRLDRWTKREGLYEDTVLAILDDGTGSLWLSGNHGITRVARADLDEVAAGRRPTLSPTHLGRPDGMRERECNGGASPAGWRASDGRLWFPTIHGVVVVDPARVGTGAVAPPARVEELSVDGHPIALDGALRLPPDTRRIDIRYTGLSLAEAERIRFRHRLKGLDPAFLEVGDERVAHYTALGPGHYRFEVSAGTASGSWSAPAAVDFQIAPRVWQTRWFALAVALAVAAALATVHRLRTARLRRLQVMLSARVEEEMRRVKILTGLLPTCAWCKKIRDDAGEWHQFEEYVSERTDATFSHGMCPECFARFGDKDGEG